MTPLLMNRDDALALARALGSRVVLSINPRSGLPADITGTVVGTDILGRVALTDVHYGGVHRLDNLRVAVADITAWRMA